MHATASGFAKVLYELINESAYIRKLTNSKLPCYRRAADKQLRMHVSGAENVKRGGLDTAQCCVSI